MLVLRGQRRVEEEPGTVTVPDYNYVNIGIQLVFCLIQTANLTP